MKNEIDILKEVTQKLETLNIQYMLTGSLAMSFYATPRMTRDIDIVIELNPFNIASFINEFQDEFYLSEEAIKDSVKHEFIFNLIHLDTSIKIDFIIRKNNEFRKTEFNRRTQTTMGDFSFSMVSKEDLIISKLFWFQESGSDMQKKDILNLLNSDLDKDYLMKWINRLNLEEEYKKVNR